MKLDHHDAAHRRLGNTSGSSTAPNPARPGAGVNRANPSNYNGGSGQGSGRTPRSGNMQAKGRTGGSEYLTILMTVSVPNWISFCTVTYSVVIVVFLVTKELYK